MMGSFRKNKVTEEQLGFDTIGGVFLETTPKKQGSFSSMESGDTQISQDANNVGWSSSGSPNHHHGSPLLVRRAVSQRTINPYGLELGDEEMLGRIMIRSRKLPKNDGYISSNHVMINNERTKRFITPLKRMPEMDEIAREQARLMAADGKLYHQDALDLAKKMGQEHECRVGENVTCGCNLQRIHKAMTKSPADINNIIDRRFTSMGVGTAKAADGTLYLCQLFMNA